MKKEKKVWKPKVGGKFYWIGSGHLLKGVHKAIWTGSGANEDLYARGEVFRSRKEAEWIYKSFNGAW